MTISKSQSFGKGALPILHPSGKTRAYVPEDFRRAIVLHITKNYADLPSSLVLAIQGNKGEGKSFQSREVCSQLGVHVIAISGAMLSGKHEKEAVEVLENAYVWASAVRNNPAAPAGRKPIVVLLIDDFDLSVASTFGDRTYTANTQLLNGFLMNLTDDPTNCGGKSTARIPIIVTGNNFTGLHLPLTRHGRMNFFEWTPSLEDKRLIVRSIFNAVLSEHAASGLDSFVEEYQNQPVSFFSALKEDMVDEFILQILEESDSWGAIDFNSIQEAATNALHNRNLEELYHLAEKRCSASPNDYLDLDKHGI